MKDGGTEKRDIEWLKRAMKRREIEEPRELRQ